MAFPMGVEGKKSPRSVPERSGTEFIAEQIVRGEKKTLLERTVGVEELFDGGDVEGEAVGNELVQILTEQEAGAGLDETAVIPDASAPGAAYMGAASPQEGAAGAVLNFTV